MFYSNLKPVETGISFDSDADSSDVFQLKATFAFELETGKH